MVKKYVLVSSMMHNDVLENEAKKRGVKVTALIYQILSDRASELSEKADHEKIVRTSLARTWNTDP
jgi:AAA+ superfamily predicted ATPase